MMSHGLSWIVLVTVFMTSLTFAEDCAVTPRGKNGWNENEALRTVIWEAISSAVSVALRCSLNCARDIGSNGTRCNLESVTARDIGGATQNRPWNIPVIERTPEGTQMLTKSMVSALVTGIVAISAQAADPDEELIKQRDLARQRAAAEVEEQWKGLPQAEIEKRRQLEALMQSSYQHIDGKRTPELVPYQIRMQHFFDRYASGTFERLLAPQLSAEDRAVLAEFSERHVAELKAQETAYDAEWMAIGARASSMNAQEIAGAIKSATQRSENALAAVYRGVIDRLSSEGRQRVNDFAFIHVRPQVAIEDPFVVANGDPEFFKDQVVKTYELRRTGKMPEPPPSFGSKSSTSLAGKKSKAATDTVTVDSVRVLKTWTSCALGR